jgi:HAD superfamily hydrolase (TIGR01509 family)
MARFGSVMKQSVKLVAVVFDMDGLLLDSERPLVEAWTEAARELDCSFAPELLLRVLGRPGAEGVALFRAALGSDFPYDQARARVRSLLSARQAQGFAVKPGARQLLACLHARQVPCAVASSAQRKQLEARLIQAGLYPHFEAFAGGDEVAHGKPAPDVFLLAAERLGVNPSACLVFEDSEHGARGAVAAGMQVVIVPDLVQPSPEARALCCAVLPSLAQAEAHCDGWFQAAPAPRGE